MARISNQEKETMTFFLNENGKIEYHKKCARCKYDCKQSFMCLEVICNKYKPR